MQFNGVNNSGLYVHQKHIICIYMGRVCDVMEILQSRLATATSRPPARDIRDTVNPPKGFDQSAMLTSYRVWDYVINMSRWLLFPGIKAVYVSDGTGLCHLFQSSH